MRGLLCLLLVLGLVGCASSSGKAGNLIEAARLNTEAGVKYAQKGEYSPALERLKRAVVQDESYANAHAGLAFVYQRLGDTRLAEKHYRRALALDDGNPALKNNFGVFLCASDQSAEAERYLLDAAQSPIYATPAAAWTNAGVCVKSRDPVRAEGYFREALRVAPDYSEALAQMALVSFARQDYLRTRAFIQRYGVLKNPNPELLYVGTRAETALGDLHAAELYATQLLQQFPQSPEAATLRSQHP
jgi:type IV pilus assembly protein PilF